MKADFQRYGLEYNPETGFPRFHLVKDDGGEFVKYGDARTLADILLGEIADLKGEIKGLQEEVDYLEDELLVLESYEGKTG